MTFTQPDISSDAATDSSPGSAGCISLDELQDYLAGWSDDGQSERIEHHLAACTDCNLALRDLEISPDTLMQSLQSTAVESADGNADVAGIHDTEDPIGAALAKSRKLMDRCPGLLSADRAGDAWQPPGQKLGGYELLRPLGRGGMGAVYLANHSQLNRQVAIKLLPKMSADDADVRARFQREIRVVGRLNHPSIVTATDAGEIDGTQFLVMEYVQGLDLSHVARLLGKVPLAEACALMRQVALGLSCAHAEGVVHRDVKPSNLMLDEAGQVKILDFGLAQLSFWNEASVELTTVGQLMGTLDYMAPEQAEFCGGVDYRADLYAMGATLFRLLCGRPPLAAAPNQSPLEKLRLLANHQPPNLDTLCPSAPPDMVTLVGSLLARNPQDRPASAAHVAERLAPFTQSADLVGLLGRAREAESQLPQQLPEKGTEQSLRQSGLNAAKDSADGGNRNRAGRWIAAAFALPLVIIAGILIKLETEKGQLVIESEVPDIAVRIVGDGKSVGEISIKPGATATRLRAGQYELVINGPSDGLTIDNNQFTIKNGATVVARIRLESTEKSLPRRPAAGGAPGPTAESELEPLYEGKPLSEWLGLLGRERSITGLNDAFKACMALTSPQTSARITKALLKTVPGLDGQRDLSPEANTRSRTIDRFTSEVLRKANPGSAYYQLWVKEFESADENWRKRLWSYHKYGDYADAAVVGPFIAWAERLITQPSVGPLTAESDIARAADVLRLISRETEDNPQLLDRIITALLSSPLGRDWWLSQPLVYRDHGATRNAVPQDTDLWPAALKSNMIKIAIEVLNDENSDGSILAQACMILAHGAELSPEQRMRALAAVNQHLVAVCADEQAMAEAVTANADFAPLATPNLLPSGRRYVRFSYLTSESKPYLVVELLDVIEGLDGTDMVPEGIRAVAARVRPISKFLNAASQQSAAGTRSSRQSGRGGFGGPPPVELRWPDLVPTDVHNTMTVRQLWGQHVATPRDWLMYCLQQHPVMYEAPPLPPQPLP